MDLAFEKFVTRTLDSGDPADPEDQHYTRLGLIRMAGIVESHGDDPTRRRIVDALLDAGLLVCDLDQFLPRMQQVFDGITAARG